MNNITQTGTAIFDPEFWKNYFQKYFSINIRSDAETQVSGAKLWPYNVTEKTIEDPQEAMIRLVVNDDKHMLPFCCCIFLTMISTQEDLLEANDQMECEPDKQSPVYVSSFTNVVLAQANNATVVALCQQLHGILENFTTRGHPMQTSPAIHGLYKVSSSSYPIYLSLVNLDY